MLLFIDVDQDKSTGWEGYDFVVNHGKVSRNSTTLKKWNGSEWKEVEKLSIAHDNNQLEISILIKVLGNSSFDFHWADNPKHLIDISGIFLHGDSAPDRRFNYRYQSKRKIEYNDYLILQDTTGQISKNPLAT